MENQKTNKVIIIIMITLTIFFLHNCKKTYVNELDKVIEEISKLNSKSDRTIDLKQVYSFDWETLYIFGEYTSLSEINEIIGFDCIDCKEEIPSDTDLYAFIKGNQITRKFEVDITKSKYNFVLEWYGGYESTQKISVKNSKFKVLNKGVWFALIPLEEN